VKDLLLDAFEMQLESGKLDLARLTQALAGRCVAPATLACLASPAFAARASPARAP
jgi:hypothetical protein